MLCHRFDVCGGRVWVGGDGKCLWPRGGGGCRGLPCLVPIWMVSENGGKMWRERGEKKGKEGKRRKRKGKRKKKEGKKKGKRRKRIEKEGNFDKCTIYDLRMRMCDMRRLLSVWERKASLTP